MTPIDRQCQAAAEGQPAQVHPPQIEGGDEVRDGVGVVGHAHLGWRVVRAAAAGRIPGDHVELIGQPRELRSPLPPVAPRAVQQHERVPAAGAPVGDLSPTDFDQLHPRPLPPRARVPGDGARTTPSADAPRAGLGGIVRPAAAQLNPLTL